MLRDEFGLTCRSTTGSCANTLTISRMRPGCKHAPGALEIFRDLKALGVVQAVVSNSDRLIVDANLRARRHP